ncbi:MAG: regulatory iron-sulfur-containing complex subunit RicT [Cytophagales bacterium]|nr:Signal peptidase-like protein [Bernardetiaceae bacterium]MDW8211170.1 regulatory iron-sulfur-containing complex subunit RicT [Cytophagales bacterium]
MGCGNCASGGCGTLQKGKVAGCRNNGACGTSGCNKLNVFDWLSNMEPPAFQRCDIVEVRFKGSKKEFFRNAQGLHLTTGEAVVVESASGGYHIGYVSLQGELVRLQMLKKKIKDTSEIRHILRIATQKDLEKFAEAQKREMPTLYRTREIIEEMGLEMKLSDVEFQADNTKATFYYSADDRVDFRELIKVLASEFRIRVEMRQISLRHEASRLGGIGVCGRELCCSTWLTEFKSVSTAAARYQNLSLNPSKLSGQCGRLKCCLNYELETYLDALVDIPKVEKPLQTARGEAHLQKTDIFKKIMWFSYNAESTWYPLSAERVRHIIELNEKGIVVESLLEQEEAPATSSDILPDPVLSSVWTVESEEKEEIQEKKEEEIPTTTSPEPTPIESTPTPKKKKRKKKASAVANHGPSSKPKVAQKEPLQQSETENNQAKLLKLQQKRLLRSKAKKKRKPNSGKSSDHKNKH